MEVLIDIFFSCFAVNLLHSPFTSVGACDIAGGMAPVGRCYHPSEATQQESPFPSGLFPTLASKRRNVDKTETTIQSPTAHTHIHQLHTCVSFTSCTSSNSLVQRWQATCSCCVFCVIELLHSGCLKGFNSRLFSQCGQWVCLSPGI